MGGGENDSVGESAKYKEMGIGKALQGREHVGIWISGVRHH